MTTPATPKAEIDKWWLDPQRCRQRSEAALRERLASGEIMDYVVDGWVVREYPGQRIERLAPVEVYRAADFPCRR